MVVLLLALPLIPSSEAAIVGGITGWVRDDHDIPQMGALVTLLTAEGRVAKRVYTDAQGGFLLDQLFPGSYSIQVSLSRFLPALKQNVQVEAGHKTYLDVHLSGLFSSLQLVFPARSEIRDMSDNWKWVLRTASATRPVLQFGSQNERETHTVLRKLEGAFGETRAYAEVSAGAGMRPSGLANQTDLGTAFAVATSLFGSNNVTVSGNVGYGRTIANSTTSFRTSYSRELGLGEPEVSLTVRQIQVPMFAQQALFGPRQAQDNTPELETFTLGFGDKVKLGELARLEYGFLYESVSFLDRLDFVSPYGRLIFNAGKNREIELRFASGVPRPEEGLADGEALRWQVSSLGQFPRMSLWDGRPTVQRAEHIEIAYREQIGDGLLEMAVYQDSLSDAAISAVVPAGFDRGNVLPDLFSRSSTLNGGHHQTSGYRVSYARRIRDRLEAAVGYGVTGVLSPDRAQAAADLSELRGGLDMERAHIIMASVSTELPGTHTRLVSSYQWVNREAAIAPDLYNDFAARSDPGLNLVIRQPLPFADSLPGKLEASADFRNLLRAGYIPLQIIDGQQMYLLQAIRSYRGALSFIF